MDVERQPGTGEARRGARRVGLPFLRISSRRAGQRQWKKIPRVFGDAGGDGDVDAARLHPVPRAAALSRSMHEEPPCSVRVSRGQYMVPGCAWCFVGGMKHLGFPAPRAGDGAPERVQQRGVGLRPLARAWRSMRTCAFSSKTLGRGPGVMQRSLGHATVRNRSGGSRDDSKCGALLPSKVLSSCCVEVAVEPPWYRAAICCPLANRETASAWGGRGGEQGGAFAGWVVRAPYSTAFHGRLGVITAAPNLRLFGKAHGRRSWHAMSSGRWR